MQIQVKILEVGKEQWTKTAKGGYGKTLVKFQGDKGEQSRNFVSYDADIYSSIKKLEAGKSYEVRIEKEGDYWNWKEIKELAGSDVIANPPKEGRASSSSNNWDERLKFDKEKQILIVRQSQVTNAVAALGPGKSIEEYCSFASKLVDFVNTGDFGGQVDEDAPKRSPGRPRKEAVADIE